MNMSDYEADLRSKLRSILHEVETGGPCKHWPQGIGPNQDDYCLGCEIGNLVQGAMLDLDEMLIEMRVGRE